MAGGCEWTCTYRIAAARKSANRRALSWDCTFHRVLPQWINMYQLRDPVALFAHVSVPWFHYTSIPAMNEIYCYCSYSMGDIVTIRKSQSYIWRLLISSCYCIVRTVLCRVVRNMQEKRFRIQGWGSDPYTPLTWLTCRFWKCPCLVVWLVHLFCYSGWNCTLASKIQLLLWVVGFWLCGMVSNCSLLRLSAGLVIYVKKVPKLWLW